MQPQSQKQSMPNLAANVVGIHCLMPCQAEGLREGEGEGERVGSYARASALIPKFLFSLGAKEDFTC